MKQCYTVWWMWRKDLFYGNTDKCSESLVGFCFLFCFCFFNFRTCSFTVT